MKVRRNSFAALLVVCATAFTLVSCGEPTPLGPSAQSAAPSADLLGTLSGALTKTGLIKCSPLPPAWGSAWVGPLGGVIQVGPHTLSVPAGALDHSVLISAYAPSDKYNRVEFQPEGLQFKKSTSLTMSYANCNLLGILLPKHIAYVDDDLNILYLLQSLDNIGAQKVTGQVNHFSDYVIAW